MLGGGDTPASPTAGGGKTTISPADTVKHSLQAKERGICMRTASLTRIAKNAGKSHAVCQLKHYFSRLPLAA
jgi:hypothetical protein